ncbi:MAG: DHH family phosphoesterase [Bacillota bacterium]|nr:DHH family phosphoesterase [Bacillota bacterium]
MESKFYRNYKRLFFIGVAVLLAFTSLALASYYLLLGIFGFLLTMGGMFGLAYLDKKEEAAREKEIVEEIGRREEEGLPASPPPEAGLALAVLQVDDYDEVFQGLAEEQRPLLVAEVDKLLREWARGLRAHLRKDGRDRYLMLLPAKELASLEESGFPILDQIRKIKTGNTLPVTLSIGAGKGGGGDPAVLGQLAQQALDLALARGGDQAVVKDPDHTWFYGGRTEAVGKRTQVRARVAATELVNLFRNCNSVVVMGHAGIDFDVLGAALGLAEAARHFGKQARVVVDHPGGTIEKLLDAVAGKHPGLLGEGKEIGERVGSDTLLLLVDVHRPEMVAYPPLLNRAGSIGVIDHHRRGEEFLERASLAYLEPAASSASELVGELIRYLPEEVALSPLTATALLAGLVVDTKQFTFATSPRTFHIAARLREAGADPAVIRTLFKASLPALLYRAQLLQNVEILEGRYALTGHEQEFPEAQVAAARAAETLLEVEGVAASFVLYPAPGGVAISARSAGDVNVHRFMERLGGGGHFTVAGAYLEGSDLAAARSRLVEVLKGAGGEKS